MSLARERLAALSNAVLQVPHNLPRLARHLLRPDIMLSNWCNAVLAAGQIPFVICRIERLGDIVATTSVASHLRDQFGQSARIAWVCADEYASVLRGNPDIDAIFVEPCLTAWMLQRRRLSPSTRIVELFLDSDRCSWTGMRVKLHKSGWTTHNYYLRGQSLLAAYSSAAGYPVPDLSPVLPHISLLRDQRQRPPDALKRIAVHFTSRDPARSWPMESALRFCKAALSAGYQLIELGNEALVASQLHDVESPNNDDDISSHLVALARVDCFVGVDSGFAHCANALRIPAVILLGNFRNFPGYCPFSGPHARGKLWQILRSASTLATLAPDDVINALHHMLENARLADQHSAVQGDAQRIS